MRRMWALGILAVLAALAPPAAQAKTAELVPVSAAELEQQLASARARGDGTTAHFLAGLTLTERLTPARLQSLMQQAPGRHSRERLIVLADEAEFQPLPPADTPSLPAPGDSEQKAILARALEYIHGTTSLWPRFSASRTALRFEGSATPIPGGLQDELSAPLGRAWLRSPASANWECPGHPRGSHERLAVIEVSTVPLIYRQGRQVHVMDAGGGEFACTRGGVAPSNDLGEMPALLPPVLSHARVTFSHWEQGVLGPLAAFHFVGILQYNRRANLPILPIDIAGEVVIEPATGTVQRFSMIRNWMDEGFLRQYEAMVEFGPVSLKGVTYFLPQRRVAVYRAPYLLPRDASKHLEATYRHYALTESPLQEYLNDVHFDRYEP